DWSSDVCSSDLECNSVDGRDLVDDPARDRLQEIVRKTRPVGGHRVLGGDGSDDDRVGVRALVALDTDRTNRREHREALPKLVVETRTADLIEQDRVSLPEGLEPLARDLADDPDREAGTGERMPPDHPLRQPELLADSAHLVLEQEAERLDELHVHLLRQTADAVVRLELGGAALASARLDHGRAEAACDEILDLR